MLNALIFASVLGGFARAQLAPSPVPSGPNFELLDNANSSVWSFDGQWGHFSAASPCPSCLAQPDPAQVQDGTWSDTSTEGASATLVFTGVGLSVFNFCPGPIAPSDPAAPPILFRSDFLFAIDGKPHGALQLADGCAAGDVYHQLVFTISGLTNGRHTFTITNNANSSDLLLDFAVVERAPKSVPPPVTTITVPPITSTGATTSTAPPAGTPTPARPPPASNPPPSSPPPTGANIHTLDNISPQVVLQGPWGTFTAKTHCPDCLVKPDFAQTFDDSYSELSGEGSATISWTGTSIFLYGICPGTVGTAQFVQSFSFSLDGADAGRHASPAGGCASNVYRQLLFSKTGLSLSAHKLVITNVQDDSFGRKSDLLLDFAVFDSAGASEPPVPPSGPALPPSGPVSGGLPPPSNPPSSPVPSGAGFLLLDDTSPQIVYDDNWGAISQKAPCAKCATHFDFSKLSGGTYHELSKPGSATIQFAGTGLSVFGVCPGTLSPSGQFLQKFTLAVDGQTDSFAGPKGGCSVNVYNQLLFEVTGLPKGEHTATISNLDSGFTDNPSDLVLDFVVVATGGLSQPATPALQPGGSDTPSTPGSGGTLPPPSNPPASPAAPTGANFRKLDDTSPQIAYDGAWGVISKAAPCASCVTKFDFSQTFNDSYHELTAAGTATIAFAGTEVYIYSVCPGTLDGGGQFLQSFTFTLDGTPSGTFNGPAGGCATNVYNQLIYKATAPSGTHTLVITNVEGANAKANPSDLIIDSVIINTAGLDQPAGPASGGGNGTSPDSTLDPPSALPTSGTFVDDTDSRWTFTGQVGTISASAPCESCLVQPDASLAYGNTWRDLSSAGSATLTFTGASSAAVYVICPGPLTGKAAGSIFRGVFNISLDGQPQPQWSAPEKGCSKTLYNVMVANVTGLDASTQHTLTVTNVISETPSDLLLDYGVLTESSASSSSSTPTDSDSSPGSQPTAPGTGSGHSLVPHGTTLGFVVALLTLLV